MAEKIRSGEKRGKDAEIPKEGIKYQGKIFEVVSERVEIDGKVFEFEKVRRSPGVRLILRDGKGNMLLTREFRREIGGFDYRLPGGKVFDTLDEFHQFEKTNADISEKSKWAAMKEAKEETGFAPDALEHYSTSKLGATVEWDLHYFVGDVDRKRQGAQELETGENIEIAWFSDEEVKKLLLEQNAFSEERSAATLFRFFHRQKDVKNSEPHEDGARLISAIESGHLGSVRVRPENLKKLKQFLGAIFVGSSLVGKTTLVDTLREAMKSDARLSTTFEIPKRVITRPQRENDNLNENQFVTTEEFDELVRSGEIGFHWERKMEGNRVERYGFLRGDSNKIQILSGNNAIINNRESIIPQASAEHALLIGVYSPEDVRRERMIQRSPDLLRDKPEEAEHRLADKVINIYPDAHILIKSYDRYEEAAKEDVLKLFTLLADLKR